MSWSELPWALLGLSHRLANFGINWLLQSTVLIVVGLATARLLARRGSATQFVVYATTLVAVLTCPLLSFGLSLTGMTQWSVAVPLPSVPVLASDLPHRAISAADSVPLPMGSPKQANRSARRVRTFTEPRPADAINPTNEPANTSELAAEAVGSAEPEPAAPVEADSPVISTSFPASPTPSFRWLLSGAMAVGCMIWLPLSGVGGGLKVQRLAGETAGRNCSAQMIACDGNDRLSGGSRTVCRTDCGGRGCFATWTSGLRFVAGC